jgi:hypothetical protein
MVQEPEQEAFPLLDRVFDRLIELLQSSPDFTPEELLQIRSLAETGGLARPAVVKQLMQAES